MGDQFVTLDAGLMPQGEILTRIDQQLHSLLFLLALPRSPYSPRYGVSTKTPDF